MHEVYTIADLASRERLDAGHEKPARLAVIGHPVAHSASPRMHQPALNIAGVEARYVRIDIESGQVAEAFARMRALGFIGCNVTVPHKLDAMDACDEIHPHARSLGAVNTIRFEEGATWGFNTDGPGFEMAIHESFGVSLASLKVAIIGAGGGAGQAIAAQCGLVGVSRMVLVNRSVDKLGPLVDRLWTPQNRTEIIALSLDDPALVEHTLHCDLIVNASSIGLKPDDPSILPGACLKKQHLVYDMIYQPAVTPLLAKANGLGCQSANGLSMLIHQGALAFQHWFPGIDPLRVMQAAMMDLRK